MHRSPIPSVPAVRWPHDFLELLRKRCNKCMALPHSHLRVTADGFKRRPRRRKQPRQTDVPALKPRPQTGQRHLAPQHAVSHNPALGSQRWYLVERTHWRRLRIDVSEATQEAEQHHAVAIKRVAVRTRRGARSGERNQRVAGSDAEHCVSSRAHYFFKHEKKSRIVVLFLDHRTIPNKREQLEIVCQVERRNFSSSRRTRHHAQGW